MDKSKKSLQAAEQETGSSSLLKRGRKGDQLAYEDFLLWCRQFLERVVSKGLLKFGSVNKDDCQDIVQESLTAIHTKRHTWDESQPVEPWVAAIARYKIVDYWRSRRREYLLEPTKELGLNSSEKIEAKLDLAELKRQVDQELFDLLYLSKVEGYTSKEISQMTGMSEENVRVSLHRLIRRLQGLVK